MEGPPHLNLRKLLSFWRRFMVLHLRAIWEGHEEEFEPRPFNWYNRCLRVSGLYSQFFFVKMELDRSWILFSIQKGCGSSSAIQQITFSLREIQVSIFSMGGCHPDFFSAAKRRIYLIKDELPLHFWETRVWGRTWHLALVFKHIFIIAFSPLKPIRSWRWGWCARRLRWGHHHLTGFGLGRNDGTHPPLKQRARSDYSGTPFLWEWRRRG